MVPFVLDMLDVYGARRPLIYDVSVGQTSL
jgi:hypothetical protein